MLFIIALYGVLAASSSQAGIRQAFSSSRKPDFPTAQTTSGYSIPENALVSFTLGGGKITPELQDLINNFQPTQYSMSLDNESLKDTALLEVMGYWFQRDTGNFNLGLRIITKEKSTIYDIPIAKVEGERGSATTIILAKKTGENIWEINGGKENYRLEVFDRGQQKYISFEVINPNDSTPNTLPLKLSA